MLTCQRQQRNCTALDGHDQKGQGLTEFALVMPLLVALLVMIILLAWVGFSYVSIASAARMGARHMLTYPVDPEDPDRFDDVDAEITYVVTTSMALLDWQSAEIAISPQSPGDRLSGTQVAIEISYPMNPPMIRIPYVVRDGFFFLLPPIVLHARSTMRLD
jgi:hypothetical protein